MVSEWTSEMYFLIEFTDIILRMSTPKYPFSSVNSFQQITFYNTGNERFSVNEKEVDLE